MIPKDLLKSTLKRCKGFIKKNPDVLDVVIFGSVVKGKEKPNDIDLLLIFKDKVDLKTASTLRNLLKNAQVTSKTYEELFKTQFLPRESILSEGVSSLTGLKLSESYGYFSFILVSYSLKNFSNSQRTKFFYALRGRNSKGLIEGLKIMRLSDTILLVPVEKSAEFREFLKKWGVIYKESEVLIPERRVPVLSQ